ncbi:FkbM family methyltransferase [Solidesulfovibrio sp.]
MAETVAGQTANQQPGPLADRLRTGTARIAQGPEMAAARRFLRPGAVVFDVGAHIGCWSLAALGGLSDVALYCFEPAPDAFADLGETAARHFPQARLANTALGGYCARRRFHLYRDSPSWSGFFRRRGEEARGSVAAPEPIDVACTTLDAFAAAQGVTHIDYLKIDVEGAETEVLAGAAGLLAAGAVDALQFEYGGTFADAGTTLAGVFAFLRFRDYVLLARRGETFAAVETWDPALETYGHDNFLALHRRHVPWFRGEAPAMLDLPALLPRNGVIPRGVIHIGAHEGRELPLYRTMGASPILFIEANPAVAARLRRAMADEPDVTVAECAITDGSAATATLHVTSMDQSSSVLPLGEHLTLYPGIVETDAVVVPAASLDDLLARLDRDPAACNLLNIDIQGAELPALRGALGTLAHIEAINAEINFRELYVGGTFFHELAAFLHDQGFVCEAAVCPYDPSWGDALFVRRRELTMTTLGQNGRFANQLFQYAFVQLQAARQGLSPGLPAWVGNALFGADAAPPRRALPVARQTSPVAAEDAVAGSAKPVTNVDLWGYFQYHSSYYAPDREAFRALFQPVPAVKTSLEAALARVMAGKKTLVALHLRRGDYGCGHFFITPSQWYRDWLAAIWPTLPAPRLYIASDDPQAVLADFADYAPISRADLGELSLPLDDYADFYVLTQANVLAISNSSFSFAAAMLNQTAAVFMRPRLGQAKLIPFDPFDAEVIFRDEAAEDFPEAAP